MRESLICPNPYEFHTGNPRASAGTDSSAIASLPAQPADDTCVFKYHHVSVRFRSGTALDPPIRR